MNINKKNQNSSGQGQDIFIECEILRGLKYFAEKEIKKEFGSLAVLTKDKV